MACVSLGKRLIETMLINDGRRFSVLKRLCSPATHSVNNNGLRFGDTESSARMKSKTTPYKRSLRVVDDPDTFGTLSADLENVLQQDATTDVEEGGRFDSIKIIPRRRSQKYYLNLIQQYVEQRNLIEAISVLETKMLKEDNVKPEYYIYTVLIAACAHAGYSKKAFHLYNQMKKRGLKVTAPVYTSLFNACANSPFPKDSLKRATNLRQLMLEKGVQPNILNYHAMIKAFGRCGDLITALSIFDEMTDKQYAVKEDTFNNLLQACISDKNAGFHHAILVWRRLLHMKVKPNVESYNLMLRAARDCSLGNKDAVQKLLEDITQEERLNSFTPKKLIQNSGEVKMIGIPLTDENGSISTVRLPEVSATRGERMIENIEHSHVVHAPIAVSSEGKGNIEFSGNICSKQVNPNLLAAKPHLGNVISLNEIAKPEDRLLLLGGYIGVLDHMEYMNVTPNIKTFTLLLDCTPQTLTAEHELMTTMKKSGIKPDIDFYNMLIRRRNVRADYKAGKEVLTFIQQEKLIPNVMTFGVLAIGCENEVDAKVLMEDMESAGYRMNAEIMGAMLHNACVRLNFSYINTVLEIMKKKDISPNLKFLEKLELFNIRCVKLLKNKTKLALVENRAEFENNLKNFMKYYNTWKKNVEPEAEQHPWRQYRKNAV
ncbi:pentatricopeptide repeat-containing protein 1, mitochondrial [Schistocerca piceifrons]|uniref:pentatricopeptide repeat-containing protein 1, mitochondrial n=1 Tax=Schistocerca piceifrons TaxID=274613 RepID=UPI001F5FD3BA|nr:pentatricopeptide repeat-containing protein 1, mitochondrial [Schistocerca piceifrons]